MIIKKLIELKKKLKTLKREKEGAGEISGKQEEREDNRRAQAIEKNRVKVWRRVYARIK